MDVDKLISILSETNGNKFCPYCGTPFKPHHSRQKTCGAPECKQLCHNEYMRERRQRQREEDLEGWRAKHREEIKKWRAKKRKRIDRDKQLKELSESWQKQDEFDKFVSEHGMDYGKIQAQKTLSQVPKIDVSMGEKKHDTLHDKDDIERSR